MAKERHFTAFQNNEQHNEPDLTRNLSSCVTFLLGRLILYVFIQLQTKAFRYYNQIFISLQHKKIFIYRYKSSQIFLSLNIDRKLRIYTQGINAFIKQGQSLIQAQNSYKFVAHRRDIDPHLLYYSNPSAICFSIIKSLLL